MKFMPLFHLKLRAILYNLDTGDYIIYFTYQIKIKNNDKCYFCGERSETLEHLFWNCAIIKDLCNNFACEIKSYIDLSKHLKLRNIMMGVVNQEHEKLINFLFVIVKRYIYVTRCKEQNIHIHSLFNYVKKYYNIDICCKANKDNIVK